MIQKLVSIYKKAKPYAFYLSLGVSVFNLLNFLVMEGYGTSSILALTGGIVAFVSILIQKWSVSERLKAIFWLGMVAYALSFESVYLLMHSPENTLCYLYATIGLCLLPLLFERMFVLPTLIGGGTLAAISYMIEMGGLPPFSAFSLWSYWIGLVLAIVILREIFKEKETKRAETESKMLYGAIAHEMATPLASINLGLRFITNYLALLEEELTRAQDLGYEPEHSIPWEELHTIPQHLSQSAQQSIGLTQMLLLKLQEGSGLGEKGIHDAAAISLRALNQFPLSEKQRGQIQLEVNENFEFIGNETLFIHVIFNLIKNALHALEGCPEEKIRIVVGKTPKTICIIDNGPGISAETLEDIFEVFYSSKEKGGGLGLPFCRMALASMGATIHCDSIVGYGTTFVIKFPPTNSKN